MCNSLYIDLYILRINPINQPIYKKKKKKT